MVKEGFIGVVKLMKAALRMVSLLVSPLKTARCLVIINFGSFALPTRESGDAVR